MIQKFFKISNKEAQDHMSSTFRYILLEMNHCFTQTSCFFLELTKKVLIFISFILSCVPHKYQRFLVHNEC